MKFLASLLIFTLSLGLSGCFEGENPLKSMPASDLATWIYKNKTPEIIICASYWENQAKAAATQLSNCNKTAENLAETLSKAGFGNVIAEDVYLPTLWQKFNEQISRDKRNSYDPEAAGKAMQLAPKGSLGERLKQMQKEKHERLKNQQ